MPAAKFAHLSSSFHFHAREAEESSLIEKHIIIRSLHFHLILCYSFLMLQEWYGVDCTLWSFMQLLRSIHPPPSNPSSFWMHFHWPSLMREERSKRSKGSCYTHVLWEAVKLCIKRAARFNPIVWTERGKRKEHRSFEERKKNCSETRQQDFFFFTSCPEQNRSLCTSHSGVFSFFFFATWKMFSPHPSQLLVALLLSPSPPRIPICFMILPEFMQTPSPPPASYLHRYSYLLLIPLRDTSHTQGQQKWTAAHAQLITSISHAHRKDIISASFPLRSFSFWRT